MKINIYQSLFNWETTANLICSDEMQISSVGLEDVESFKYYQFDTFELHDPNKGEKIYAKIFCKSKVKGTMEWQSTLLRIINREQVDDLMKFMPSESKNFDAILIFSKNKSSQSKVYFTTYGQSFHDIDNFINRDFGIDFAERTLKNENVVMKNVNYFQQNKL